MGVDGESASAFAEDGDFDWITAKCVDVSLNPVESGSLIQEADIALCDGEFGRAWEPKY